MPLHIDDDGSSWRLDFTIEDLHAAIKSNALPDCFLRTSVGDVPKPLRYWCERVSPNYVWPLQSDFVPLWTTNGTSCLAFEPSIDAYTYQHIEDVPENSPQAFASFKHVTAWVLLDLIGGDPDDDIRAAAAFFGFDRVDDLLTCSDPDDFARRYPDALAEDSG